ncbi:universal bacterial protein YeaZ [Aeromicrobium marinum DSM 15272]|uniref:Universal bacterial protein YeaZ n=1 Tax=Aeromicrobium marinum DSM 15272 TaxID=585531 RepID=E2SG38_9ACTN|nr:tRNA (adenosine(37)-N6)-threonylcarbamoyltransferase complex dimerization subunit type 1 TsaB [Aeromicrobium marinum]EFQ81795.1 universal bacterial protein YeaZ [Aeromicrobium marinum DSM 15272]
MLLLAFDTATPVVTVAVHDGRSVLADAHAEGSMVHGERLAPAVQEAMAAAGAAMGDLTDVAVGVGPGPFTGLRVGVVTALTLAHTLGLRSHGVCTLDTVAAQVEPAGPYLVATDARRKEVYWARYDADGGRVEGPDVATPATLAARFPGLPVHGPGARLYADLLTGGGDAAEPSARVLAELVVQGRVAELPLQPLYLRRPDAVPRVVRP